MNPIATPEAQYEMPALNESEFMLPTAVHIVIDTQIQYNLILYLKATKLGIPLSALYQALSSCCNSESKIRVSNGAITIDWDPDTYIMPTSWLDGTQYIEVQITNNGNKADECEDLLDSTLDSNITTEDLSKSRRSRERKISEVSEKVNEWRRICLKLKEQMPDVKKISEKAAGMIGIPKKSLDDYMHQIKLGKKYNFDFETNTESKIGILRQFNRRNECKRKRSHKRSL